MISGIQEPVRFLIEGKARICLSNGKGEILSQEIGDTIWSSFKKITPLTEEFEMILKAGNQEETYEVLLLESKSEAERRAKLRQSAAGQSILRSRENTSFFSSFV